MTKQQLKSNLFKHIKKFIEMILFMLFLPIVILVVMFVLLLSFFDSSETILEIDGQILFVSPPSKHLCSKCRKNSKKEKNDICDECQMDLIFEQELQRF